MNHYKDPYKPTRIMESNKGIFRGSFGADNGDSDLFGSQSIHVRYIYLHLALKYLDAMGV